MNPLRKLIDFLRGRGIAVAENDAAGIERGIASLAGDDADHAMTLLSAAAGGGDDGPTSLSAGRDDAADALAAEQRRAEVIRKLGAALKVADAVVAAALAEGDDMEAAKKRMRESLRTEITGSATRDVTVGNGPVQAAKAGVVDGLLLRAGVSIDKPSDLGRQWAGRPFLGMCRAFLQASGGGRAAAEASDAKIADAVLKRGALSRLVGGEMAERLSHSTSDFGSILQDAVGKAVLSTYQSRQPTWTRWAKRGTASDYRAIQRVMLDFSGTELSKKDADGGETKYGVVTDRGESYFLADRATIVSVTRAVLVNDDLDLFAEIPRAFTALARGAEDRAAYDALAGTALMSDGKPLFHTAHKNLITGAAAGEPSVATLAAARVALASQTVYGGDVALSAEGAHVVTPLGLQTTAEILVGSAVVPGATNGTLNPFQNRFDVTASHLLDLRSPTDWYIVADAGRSGAAAVEVSFLADEPDPVVTSETDFDTDDMRYKVRHTCAAKALDYKAAVKIAGSGA